MEFRDRICPLCGSNDESIVRVRANYDETKLGAFSFASRKLPEFMHYRMLQCPTCDLLYATPAPEASWLEDKYEGADFNAGPESEYAACTYATLLNGVRGLMPDLSGALDIGAGDGAFIEKLLDAGFTGVIGIEPSSGPVRNARPKARECLSEGFFEGSDFESKSMSLITCFQTLEHVDNPKLLLEEIYRILKPGGVFLTAAHNHRALSAKVLGARSPIFDIEHLQIFSLRSLEEMLERTGFVDISVKPLRNAYPMLYWVKLMPLPRALKNAIRGIMIAVGMGDFTLSFNAGNISAMARKPL